MLLIEDLQGVDPGRPDPTGKSLNVSPVGNANATRAWIAAVNAQGAAGCLEAWSQGEPKVIPPWFRLPQGVLTRRQGGGIAGRPTSVSLLPFRDPTGCLPSRQQ